MRLSTIFTAAILTLSFAPAASATTFRFPQRTAGQSARSYNTWANGKLTSSHIRITRNVRRSNMRPARKSHALANLNMSSQILRARINKVGADEMVTQGERAEIGNLNNAIRHDLRAAYGNVDSWSLL